MYNKFIRKIVSKQEEKIVLENFSFLFFLQVANYILPLATLPYLVRILGPERFGLLSFANALIQYFVVFTEYGFNLSATREISISRSNSKRIAEICNSVMIIKFFFLVISFGILSSIVFVTTRLRNDWPIYYLTFGMVIGNVLFPVWFFQGMQIMKYITILNIVAKLLFTMGIFIFVKDSGDLLLVPLITSIGFIITGIIGLWFVYTKFNIIPKLPPWDILKKQLVDGWSIFLSTIAISLYTTSNTIILGVFCGNKIVGYYSAADKIIRAVQRLLQPISQALYPYTSRLVNQSRKLAVLFLRKLIIFIGIGTFILSLVIFIFAQPIIILVLGKQYVPSVIVLRILSSLPFITGLSNVLGVQTMLTFDFKKEFSNILITASILSILVALILTPLFKQMGVASSVLMTELFVTWAMLSFLKNKGVLNIKFSVK